MIAHCANPSCPEVDEAKESTIVLLAGEQVMCGECGQPCVDGTGNEVTG